MKKNSDAITTILGVLLGGLLAANLDFGKLFQGDKVEAGKAIGAVLLAAQGWLTNKGQQSKGDHAVEKQ